MFVVDEVAKMFDNSLDLFKINYVSFFEGRFVQPVERKFRNSIVIIDKLFEHISVSGGHVLNKLFQRQCSG
jgi:hypothetical protein